MIRAGRFAAKLFCALYGAIFGHKGDLLMLYRKLGRTDVSVSAICLGTMTWGSQNTEAEAFEQMDYALDNGVNFWDTAELYPVNPACAETYTTTETYIGNWMKVRGKRDRVVLATKVAGPGRPWIRNGMGLSPWSIKEAIDGSLKRLQTDYVDLYQLHWPQRGTYHFGQNWTYTPSKASTEEIRDDMLDTLETMGELVKAGKVRHFGLSNESAWGTLEFLRLAEKHNLPKPVSTQNEFSLMYRTHEMDMNEVSVREGVSLLPYSPLAAGWLTGKYYGGVKPEGSRFASPHYATSQRLTPQAQKAADAYADVAKKHGLDPAQMALAWTLERPFVASTIIGATTMAQLKTDIAAFELVLNNDVRADLEAVRRDWPMPY
jgi:aryl-alcohol dehydrogenase-like predicted oxidoreductase